MPTPVLDLVTARRWAVSACVVLAGAREQIDSLNVFPVADGDTGTNMYLTMDGALEFMRGQFEMGAGTERLDEGLALIARGMLLAARGNSGVILSQLTRGLSEAVGPHVEVAGPQELAHAFETAAQTAWDALAAPVEGTILSVARAAAEGARTAVDRGYPRDGEAAAELTVLDVVREALDRARQALAETPSQLPALQIAGVVDAGGAGLVLVIEALQAVLEERPRPTVDDLPDWWVVPRLDSTGPKTGPETGPECVAEGEDTDDVEVMYLLTGTDVQRADRLRAHLARIGSSVVVAGGPADYRVHVHLDEPRLAVEAGTFAGLVQDVRLTSLRDGQDLDAVGEVPDHAAPPAVTVVACGLGEGIEALLLEAGAQVVPSGPRRRASAGQLLAAMWASGSPHIIVLPNDADTLLVATAAAQEASREGLQVRVVPTATLVQGLAALAVLDAEADPADIAQEMTEAARACSTGALTRADRDAETRVGPCRADQWLGIVDGAIVALDDEVAPVARVVTDLLCREGAEVLTVLTGQAARPEEIDPVLREFEARHPGIEVVRIDGGQPTYPYLLGVE